MTEQINEKPDLEETPGRVNLWQTSSTEHFSKPVRILGLFAVAAIAWCVAEMAWPVQDARVPDLLDVADAVEHTSSDTQRRAPSLSTQVFAARRLFIPEVPVESSETSRAVVDEMLQRLRLSGVIEQDGEMIAYVLVDAASPGSGASRAPGRTAGATSTASPAAGRRLRVTKGDRILDFEVEEITADSIRVKVANFEATITF